MAAIMARTSFIFRKF